MQKSPLQFLNVSQLAAYLTLSESAIWRLKSEGLPWLYAGQRVIFNPDEVVKWLNDRTAQQIADREKQEAEQRGEIARRSNLASHLAHLTEARASEWVAAEAKQGRKHNLAEVLKNPKWKAEADQLGEIYLNLHGDNSAKAIEIRSNAMRGILPTAEQREYPPLAALLAKIEAPLMAASKPQRDFAAEHRKLVAESNAERQRFLEILKTTGPAADVAAPKTPAPSVSKGNEVFQKYLAMVPTEKRTGPKKDLSAAVMDAFWISNKADKVADLDKGGKIERKALIAALQDLVV